MVHAEYADDQSAMVDNRKAAYVALNFVNGVGPKMLETILCRFAGPEAAIGASVEDLCAIPRLTSPIAAAIARIDVDAVAAALIVLEQVGVQVHTLDDAAYPPNLRQIPNPPSVLFQRGSYGCDDAKAIAIVGTRRPSETGAKTARRLASGLAERGFTVVSGLASGIDTSAHQGAIAAGGRTFAVLGSGIHTIHPRQNESLAEQIWYAGAIFSEFRPNAGQTTGMLMSRNRIVTGLALGTIVVEAGARSGSIDAAKQTLKQNRPLFVVENAGAGNQRLIADGATPISELAESVLDGVADEILGGELTNK